MSLTLTWRQSFGKFAPSFLGGGLDSRSAIAPEEREMDGWREGVRGEGGMAAPRREPELGWLLRREEAACEGLLWMGIGMLAVGGLVDSDMVMMVMLVMVGLRRGCLDGSGEVMPDLLLEQVQMCSCAA